MRTSNITTTSLLACASVLAVQSHAADEAALYDLAPKNSAFVRLISNVSDKSISMKVEDKLLLSENYCQASNYEYVNAGDYQINIEDMNWSGTLNANKTYTFVMNDNHINVIENDIFKNPKKGQFSTYNLTDKETLSVKTQDGKKTVFPEVNNEQHVSREVNPIKIGLAVFDADSKLVEAGTAHFQRGKSNNLFVCGSEQNYLASWTNQ